MEENNGQIWLYFEMVKFDASTCHPIDNQPPVLYLPIRLRSKDLKHLIPRPVYLDYRVSIYLTCTTCVSMYIFFLIQLNSCWLFFFLFPIFGMAAMPFQCRCLSFLPILSYHRNVNLAFKTTSLLEIWLSHIRS